jgi:phosphoribosylaminoimidazole-succinocarboxamide synthase
VNDDSRPGELLYEGKAKKVFTTDDPDVVLVRFKDDATAFNAQKRGTIAGKGAVNNAVSAMLYRELESHGVPDALRAAGLRDATSWCGGSRSCRSRSSSATAPPAPSPSATASPEGRPLDPIVIEWCYKSDELGDPPMNDATAVALGFATARSSRPCSRLRRRRQRLPRARFAVAGLELIDFKLEFGVDAAGELRLWRDEISPDTCRPVGRLRESAGRARSIDKDRFRRDALGRRRGGLPGGRGAAAHRDHRPVQPGDGRRRARAARGRSGRLRARHPELPLVLFGHSVGGLVSLRAVQTGAVAPSVKVLSSPLLRSGMQPPKLVTSLLMALGGPFPRMPTVGVDPDRLSHDPDEVAAYREDPAVFHGPVKARIGAEVVRHGELALEHASAVDVPVLLIHGREDRIADPAASVELHAHLPDAALQLVDGGKHELFHDAFADDVTADVVRFIDRQLQSRDA